MSSLGGHGGEKALASRRRDKVSSGEVFVEPIYASTFHQSIIIEKCLLGSLLRKSQPTARELVYLCLYMEK
jgi:hypothetical protein